MKLEVLLKDLESVDSYILFREIEDWCHENIPRHKWRFSYSPAICVHGVEIPGRIIFKDKKDMQTLRLKFSR